MLGEERRYLLGQVKALDDCIRELRKWSRTDIDFLDKRVDMIAKQLDLFINDILKDVK